MATVFMKWLETSPKNYDRGIQMLTLGRLTPLKERIAREYAREGAQVLEIGCGTGTLTALMAARGAVVTAIDASPRMLAEAEKKFAPEQLGEQVVLKMMDASLIGERMPEASFDLIVSTLVFSELPPDMQRHVLAACARLLAPGGRLLIADEVRPARTLPRVLFSLVRGPLVLLTWLLTRTTTAALHNFEARLEEAGYHSRRMATHLGGSLVLFEAALPDTATPQSPAAPLAAGMAGQLRHRVTLGTFLKDLWALFFRIIPPYPKFQPGLYAVGAPDASSPVLVTGNFDLTVRRVVQAIDGQVDVWLLVADSAGINVWCAAGGGFFTAEKVIAALKSSHVADVVRHRALVLPQLAANGVDGWRIRQETGWGVHWGPARAEDIPAYLSAKRKKTNAMRWVVFPLKDRLEMTAAVGVFYLLLLGVVLAIFWRPVFWSALIASLVLTVIYGVFLPWIPGRDGIGKGISLALLTVAGVLVWGLTRGWLPVQVWNWSLGMGYLAFFVGAEFQGMSPRMRGEQGNWGIEAVVGAVVLAAYFLPRLAGWW